MPRKAAKKTEPGKNPARTKRTRPTEPTSPAVPSEAKAAPSLEQIRDRAYQIFRRGVNPRDPVADWLQAERELSGDPRA
jgi:hypothetical protein